MNINTASILALLFVSTIGISSCKISQPEFRRVENYKLNREGANFTLGADVVCYNPNRVRFTIQNLAANVFLNNQKVTMLGKEMDLKVKGKSEFSVPLSITLTGNDMLKNVFSNLGNLFKSQSANLLILGNVKFKAYAIIKKELPFRYEKKIDINSIH